MIYSPISQQHLVKVELTFYQILRQENQGTLDYLKQYSFCKLYYQQFIQEYQKGKVILPNKKAFQKYCKEHQITSKYLLIKIEEAFLIGTLFENGLSNQTLIHSDGASQFNLFEHSLCWKHTERPLVNLQYYNDYQYQHYQEKKQHFWQLYQSLKAK